MANDSIIIKKKKVVGHGGHHGGSWKVAYADFVTAMMAFFMVLWIMGLSDETKASIQGYFNDPQLTDQLFIEIDGVKFIRTGIVNLYAWNPSIIIIVYHYCRGYWRTLQ